MRLLMRSILFTAFIWIGFGTNVKTRGCQRILLIMLRIEMAILFLIKIPNLGYCVGCGTGVHLYIN
jgi:hypothetical protein